MPQAAAARFVGAPTVLWRPGVRSPFGGGEVGSAQVPDRGRPTTFDQRFWFTVAAFRPRVVLRR